MGVPALRSRNGRAGCAIAGYARHGTVLWLRDRARCRIRGSRSPAYIPGSWTPYDGNLYSFVEPERSRVPPPHLLRFQTCIPDRRQHADDFVLFIYHRQASDLMGFHEIEDKGHFIRFADSKSGRVSCIHQPTWMSSCTLKTVPCWIPATAGAMRRFSDSACPAPHSTMAYTRSIAVHPVTGGSILATQLEKMRHSTKGRRHSAGEKARQMLSASRM